MITIDGETYNIGITLLKRKAEFLDKYAERTVDGILHRELIGVYFNYQLTLDPGTDTAEYARLWDKLTEPDEFHQVTVWDENGEYTFNAYFSSVSDELRKVRDDTTTFWKSLTVNFIAKSPART